MLPEQAHNLAMRITACTLSVPPLLFAAALSAQPIPNPQEIRFRVPMACAADATIRAAEYPEAIRVYDDGQPPRSFEEADRAALGLLWRHRRAFAEEVAIAAFRELFGRPPTDEELSDERSRWVRTLMSNPEAVGANCEALYEVADRSCPTPRSGQW